MSLSRTIPAFPVRNVVEAVAFYNSRLGFATVHLDPAGFAIVARDDAELNLWQANDERWRSREVDQHPVSSGAESFIAGTASARIQTDDVDSLYAELSAAKVLHPTDRGAVVETEWGTREFAVLDLEGNLLTFFERR